MGIIGKTHGVTRLKNPADIARPIYEITELVAWVFAEKIARVGIKNKIKSFIIYRIIAKNNKKASFFSHNIIKRLDLLTAIRFIDYIG